MIEGKKKKERPRRTRDFKDCEFKIRYAGKQEAKKAEPDQASYPCARCGKWHTTSPGAYEFGLLPPRVNGKLVSEQMYLGHRYRNTLVEIEQRRIAEVRALLNDPVIDTELQEATKAKDEALRVILLQRKSTRSRSESPEQREQLRTLKLAEKALFARAKQARTERARRESVQVGIAWAMLMADHRVRVAQHDSNVFWGTYLLHNAAMKQAKSKGDPRFVKWTGNGRVGVQLQGGMAAAAAWSGKDRRLQLIPSPNPPTGRRLGRNSALRMRIGSEGRDPIWAEWPLTMHRPLPELGELTYAVVSRRRIGSTTKWKLHITVDDTPAKPAPESGAVALNLGWALRDDGSIRAGYVVGDDGWRQEIVLPLRDIEALGKADHIRSIRDRNLDEIKAKLSQWSADQEFVPDWFAEATRYLPLLRSPKKLYALHRDWQMNWWEEGAVGYDMLETWVLGTLYRQRRCSECKAPFTKTVSAEPMTCAKCGHLDTSDARWRRQGGDVHLERYETGLRETALLRRREGYRILAAQLARRYRTLLIDNTDLRRFAQKAKPEDKEMDHEGTTARRRYQRLAAPSVLKGVMVNAFSKARTEIRSAVNITRKHGDHFLEWQEGGRVLRCTCGQLVDQDENACRNLLDDWHQEKRAA